MCTEGQFVKLQTAITYAEVIDTKITDKGSARALSKPPASSD